MKDEHAMYGSMPIPRLFLKIAVPGMISMLVWAICSITDGVFVGNSLGAVALAALNLAWPVITIATAVADMIAAGSSVRISMCLGNGDVDGANRIFSRSVLIILGVSVAFMALGTTLAEPAMRLMGADETLAALGAEYLSTFALLAPGSLLFFALDNYLRICGKVNFSMYANMTVAVLNIALDALFLLGFGWGVWSAALATSLSMVVGTAVSLYPLLRGSLVLRFVRGGMGRGTLRNILYNGSASFFNSVSGSIFLMVANAVLLAISGTYGVSAYGIMMYINSIVSYLFAGMAVSVQPALSYNHGSGDGTRVRDMIRMLMLSSMGLSVVMFVIVYALNEPFASMFLGDNDPEVGVMAAHGMAIMALSFLTSWVSVDANQILSAVDRPRLALTVGILSQMVVPVGLLVPMSLMGIDGVWWSMVVSAAASAAIGAALLWRIRRDGILGMHDPVPGWSGQ